MEKLSYGVQLLYHLFLSQTADPPLSKAMKVARLQLAYKPDSSLSQRALLLSSLSYVSPFPISVISHFFVSHLPVPFCECVCLFRLYFTSC